MRNHQVDKIDDTKILEGKEKADRSQVSDKEVEVISMIKREHVSEIDQDISTLYKCPLCQKKYLSADITVKHIVSQNFPRNAISFRLGNSNRKSPKYKIISFQLA